ncbi:MAG: DUF6311 domain-containing protein [Woeseiaceae bacterium]
MNDPATRSQVLLEALWAPRSSSVLYGISALLGLATVALLFDFDFLLGTSAYWQNIVGDAANHVAGYYYYVQDDWRYPIFFTKNLGYPEGASIIFTDSVPVLSLLVKSLREVLPDGFNVFGMWLAACYVLQGVGITALVIALGNRDIASTVAATILALSLPAFLVRVELASLSAQFLLTFALALYFHIVRGERLKAAIGCASVLALVSLVIHPYLFAMVFAILAAAIAQRVLDQPRWWRSAFAYSAAVAAALVVMLFVTGYMRSGLEGGLPSGFGDPRNSLDALAPVLPRGGSGLLPWGDSDFATLRGDHYNYFGLGLLLLIGVHLLVSSGAIFNAAKRHLVLLLLLAGFALFAMSNTIRVAGAEVLSFQIPMPVRWLVTQFRGTARFFWPATYVILAGVVVLTAQRFRRPGGILLLSVAVALQLFDTAPLRANVSQYTRGSESEKDLLDRATWNYLISNHDGVQVLPSFPCRSWHQEDLRNLDLSLQLLAAKNNVRINSVFISGNRTRSTKDCGKERDSVVDLQPTARDLYVFFSDHYSPSVVRRLFGDRGCRRFEQGYACTRQWHALERARDLSAFTSLESPRHYRLGSPIDFRADGDSRDYLAGGWLMPDSAGSEVDGGNAYVQLTFNEPIHTALSLLLLTHPVVIGRQSPVVNVEVVVNETPIGSLQVDTRRSELQRLSAPIALMGENNAMTIQFRHAGDAGADRAQRNRRLYLGVQTLTVNADL